MSELNYEKPAIVKITPQEGEKSSRPSNVWILIATTAVAFGIWVVALPKKKSQAQLPAPKGGPEGDNPLPMVTLEGLKQPLERSKEKEATLRK